jgi:hypothetical protein
LPFRSCARPASVPWPAITAPSRPGLGTAASLPLSGRPALPANLLLALPGPAAAAIVPLDRSGARSACTPGPASAAAAPSLAPDLASGLPSQRPYGANLLLLPAVDHSQTSSGRPASQKKPYARIEQRRYPQCQPLIKLVISATFEMKYPRQH